jgi:prephenate dehydrogenase
LIGIVGYGRFGALMTRYLSADFPVAVYTRRDMGQAIAEAGATPASLERVCQQRFVVLSVPISAMEETLKIIAPLLRRDAVVVDVCSVKQYPAEWMQRLLPTGRSILATHPMFGPDSAAQSLLDRKIVLCNVSVPAGIYRRVTSYLRGKGLVIIETTPEDHDRQIAVSLSLTHFIGRGLEAFGAKEMIIDTEGYKRLLHILGVVTHDTQQLFQDMHRYNPYAAQQRRALITALHRIDDQLHLAEEE